MKAIGYKKPGPVTDKQTLIEFDTDLPIVGAHDLLVEVRGLSVNPVDVKVRTNALPEKGTKIIGYDAAGIVRQVGTQVKLFKTGDEVFYAGDLTRPGTNAEFHVVDEQIVGKKPTSLSFAEAAALPLTSITAWEILFDCFALAENGGEGDTLLIVGGAGGVGSILIQLAKQLTKLTLVATASRPETQAWVEKMGADHVINHRESLVDQMRDLALTPRYVASLTATDQHFSALIDLIAPRGHIALIDDPTSLDIRAIKRKALSLSCEFMFTRSMFKTPDMIKQHLLLNRVAGLVDANIIRSTATQNLGKISAALLQKAHELQDSGRMVGKNVLEGFH